MVPMRVRILFFARLRDLLGTDSVELDCSEIESVGDAYRILLARHPELEAFSRSLLVAVNQEFADWDTPVREGDELALFPPVSGGQPPEDAGYPVDAAGDIYRIVRESIHTQGLVSQLTRDQDGAAVTFFGIVRDNTRGRRTTHLYYEAYEPMALREMREIGEFLRQRWQVGQVAMVHRLGRLEIGEVSVAIVITSPHRGVAFEACRYAIDRLKQTVPIWKKEFFEDGEVWVEGESRPVEGGPAPS
jgi:molybdopterin synthase catalytic subunit